MTNLVSISVLVFENVDLSHQAPSVIARQACFMAFDVTWNALSFSAFAFIGQEHSMFVEYLIWFAASLQGNPVGRLIAALNYFIMSQDIHAKIAGCL